MESIGARASNRIGLGCVDIYLDALATQDLSAARMELGRMALMTLVDPDEYGGFKVLAQAKGLAPAIELLGFESKGT